MSLSLTSTPDRFSDDAWNLLLSGEQEARRWKHEYFDVEHLLQVLFNNENYRDLVQALPVNDLELLDKLEEFLANIQSCNSLELFIGEDLEILLDKADTFRGSWGSRFIEISHILIAIGRDKRIGSELFNELGLTSEILEGELKSLPKPIVQRTTNINPLTSTLLFYSFFSQLSFVFNERTPVFFLRWFYILLPCAVDEEVAAYTVRFV